MRACACVSVCLSACLSVHNTMCKSLPFLVGRRLDNHSTVRVACNNGMQAGLCSRLIRIYFFSFNIYPRIQ